MGTPINVSEDERSLYVRAHRPSASFRATAEHDAYIDLYRPACCFNHTDQAAIAELTRQAEHWGFTVDNEVERTIHDSGMGPCVKFVLCLTDNQPDNTTAFSERVSQYVLQQIAQVSMVASGNASIEELTLEGKHIATEVTLAITEGEVDDPDFSALRNSDGLEITKEPNGTYTFMVRVTPDVHDSIYDPVQTAGYVAKWMGLFLIDPIPEPVRTPLHREPEVIEARRV